VRVDLVQASASSRSSSASRPVRCGGSHERCSGRLPRSSRWDPRRGRSSRPSRPAPSRSGRPPTCGARSAPGCRSARTGRSGRTGRATRTGPAAPAGPAARAGRSAPAGPAARAGRAARSGRGDCSAGRPLDGRTGRSSRGGPAARRWPSGSDVWSSRRARPARRSGPRSSRRARSAYGRWVPAAGPREGREAGWPRCGFFLAAFSAVVQRAFLGALERRCLGMTCSTHFRYSSRHVSSHLARATIQDEPQAPSVRSPGGPDVQLLLSGIDPLRV